MIGHFSPRDFLQPEVLEDVEDCGIPGTEEDETSARSVADEVTVEECLWDCEWQHNPF